MIWYDKFYGLVFYLGLFGFERLRIKIFFFNYWVYFVVVIE